MIQLENVTLTYPDGESRLVAVDAVDLQVPRGQIAAITGPSGSGKSSLLAVAATLISPDSGKVFINGVDVTRAGRAKRSAIRRREIGIVFQQSNLLPSLTAREQIEVMRHLGSAEAEAKADQDLPSVDDLLDRVGLSEHANKRPNQLSGGQSQRINIARALANNPSVLIVDEPTSSLDTERGAQIIELLQELTDTWQTSTMLVTHDQSHLASMGQHLTMIDGDLRQNAEAVSVS